ncbi:30S ribosomal protein S7 [Candidatus Carsonella ruddii]|uniref:Small ribosomal subunit protein uS7 n=1 Tax=Carsonella ruddii TaxID=114186 RepID=A0AAJ6FDQ3_CARRU|nr:30S ribosomal protein S7 [Candidatus Carsonella ruddii]WGS66647.1 30S ribosomal protein S7 [Candidatus Carsonella ruddii]WGS66843.1 30S ribosomal protein S7 [Candidatus Carsonella ruddii]WGS67035.1 30S ribosomal protein S7 [Candidatus Carsonella ruddii]WGS67227.1 30S ribosomal protein S7 [Candidatus Carsonella ruddii]WMC18244.1 MAG: 30S ribosomal protein S7 [Candidatus Carsonella ruddii]
MSRKKRYLKTIIFTDPRYGSYLISKFINYIMKNGKKQIAQKIFYYSINLISIKLKKNCFFLLKKILFNVLPLFEIKKKKIGGVNYNIPFKINLKRSLMFSMKWIINNAKKRNENGFKNKLVGELIDSYFNNSYSIKQKENVLKVSEQNKAYSNFKL